LGPSAPHHEFLNVEDYFEERRLTKKIHRF
jgi:hypothetical protein